MPVGTPLPTQTYDVVNIDAVAATIRKMESGDNYTISSPNSSASGAYQFLDSTWESLARQYNNPQAIQYARAKDAPPAVQDAIAKRYISDILAANGNDVASIPETWYVGNVNLAKSQPDIIPSGNSISIRDYVNKWLSTFNGISGQSPGNMTIVGGAAGVVGNAGDIASQAAQGAINSTPIQAIGNFLSLISSKSTWIRVGMFIGGLGLIFMGLYLLAERMGAPSATTVATTAAKT